MNGYLKYWPVLVFIVAATMALGADRFQLNDHSRRLTLTEKTVQVLTEDRAVLKQQTIDIKEGQRAVQRDIKEILKELRGRPNNGG